LLTTLCALVSRVRAHAQVNVRSLSDVNKDDEDERRGDGPDPQEWYTGGASSGQSVIDPRQRPETRLGQMFDSARAHGVGEGTHEDLNPNERGARGARVAFQGRARTLGGDAAAETAEVGDADVDVAADSNAIQSTVVTFWQNGFTIDDGPLRGFDDPANVAFMESIARGEAPAELLPRDRNTRMNINLIQRHEPYVPPAEPKYKAFGGSGRTLASEPTTAPPPSAAGASVGDWTVDESQPTTSIQIRLRDGSRLVGKFNTSHTVAHIRSFIANSRPSESFAYALQLSGFPPKTLDDDAHVISDGLAGAVVIQR
jgi:UBX domain-containing protein 1